MLINPYFRMLETLLDSQIATTSNPTLLQKSVARPEEETWLYDRLEAPIETELYQKLSSQFGNISVLENVFRYSYEASSSLGRWCADWIWSYTLAEDTLQKYVGRISKKYMRGMPQATNKGADAEIKRLKDAVELVKEHKTEVPIDSAEHLSPKVRLLHHQLLRYYERKTDTKCIVFVKQRHTARLLCDLFSRIGTRHLRPGALIGVRLDADGKNVTFRQQFLTLLAFRKGEINCLVSSLYYEQLLA